MLISATDFGDLHAKPNQTMHIVKPILRVYTIENPTEFSKRMLKCKQKVDKMDFQKDFLHCFKVLNTFSEE